MRVLLCIIRRRYIISFIQILHKFVSHMKFHYTRFTAAYRTRLFFIRSTSEGLRRSIKKYHSLWGFFNHFTDIFALNLLPENESACCVHERKIYIKKNRLILTFKKIFCKRKSKLSSFISVWFCGFITSISFSVRISIS